MAKKTQAVLKLEIVAGKAQPAPPLGPMLGANGVNIGTFIKEFNEKTSEYIKQFPGADVKIKAKLIVYKDRSYDLELVGPVTSNLILWKLKKKKGAGEPNKENIGTITRKDLEEIAEIQKNAMNTQKLESMIKIIAGTAKNMGIKIEAGAVKQ